MDELIRFENTFKVLQQYGRDVANTYRSSLEMNDKKATGKLISSIDYNININGEMLQVFLNLEEYWKYVENGRKAYGKHKNGEWPKGAFPPVGKLIEWIRVRQLPTKESTHNKNLPTEKQLSYLIGRKIAEEGIKPKPILQGTLDFLNQKYHALIKEAVMKDISEAVSKTGFTTVIQFLK